MRARGPVAATAAVAGAATVHALDVAGLLPGVHETVEVRTAMGPAGTVGWLALAAGLGAVAARTRPVITGGAAALLVSGIPELVGRHDPGAVGEPAAVAGALVQWLLLLAVVALAVAIDQQLSGVPLAAQPGQPGSAAVSGPVARLTAYAVGRNGRPRAPPPPVPSLS